MERIILSLLLFGMTMAAIKLAIILLILAGLIFRIKETLGVLMLLGLGALAMRNPLLAGIPIAILLIFGTYKALTEPS